MHQPLLVLLILLDSYASCFFLWCSYIVGICILLLYINIDHALHVLIEMRINYYYYYYYYY